MKHTSFITASAILAAFALCAAPASAQSRGRASGPVVGHAAPRVGVAPRVISPRVIGVAPYRPYAFGYRSGLRIGLFAGYGYPYGYYGYPYGDFGYPYGYYGYPYAYDYLNGYSAYGYGYPGYYAPPPAGYLSAVPGHAYGGVRIKSRARDAQVFADGYYVGIVDDFDGTFQHLNLEAGPHHIEVRPPNAPPIAFDVNVRPGETITYHADVR
jgi:hypothetical protein